MEKKIHELVEQLGSPKDYFKGLGEFTFPIPSEILLFHRDKFGGDLDIRNNDIHYRYVLIINFGDPVKLLVDGESIELKSNSFLLILPYQYHRYYNNYQKNIFLFYLAFELEENVFFEQFRNMIFKYNDKFDQLLGTLVNSYQSKKTMILPYYTGYFLSSILSESEPYILRSDKTKDSKLVIDICHNIYKNKKISIGELCRITSFSDSYLRRVFKKIMSITLGQYILEIRMYEAMKYLTLSDLSISEVAEKTGYDSIYSFSRSFKKSIGISPKDYRIKKKSTLSYSFRNNYTDSE